MVGIILLAMVALFLAMRLYSVLGKRTGHEQTLARPAEERLGAAPAVRALPEATPEGAPVATEPLEPTAMPGIRAIAAADGGLDVDRFLSGASSAYRMILEAYWKGDEETLATLAGEDVRSAFSEAIKARGEAGHVLDNRLVRIEKAVISQAALDGQTARITVRFDADIAAVTRDKDSNVVAGSLVDAVPTHDVWTFARVVKSSDPNWMLVETDEAV